MLNFNNLKIGIIGLGYVGLPLALAFAKKFNVVGYDINKKRIEDLSNGIDVTRECTSEQLFGTAGLKLTSDKDQLASCNCYIVTVPTPIDEFNRPDLTPLLNATKMVGKLIAAGDIVIYESTVYPGCTEDDCVPLLEKVSGLEYNRDFFCGYSPERINPGDKERSLENIKKITSGSTKDASIFVNKLYSKIIIAGTHSAESIRVAEAAKIIENTQRDLNIALINELALIFNKMNIDTEAVLNAAATKWNFLHFKPGLVGGHCIGVDPYYLTHKAQAVGYHPEVILSGRRLNDDMGSYVVSQLVKCMNKKSVQVSGAHVLVMGFAFKENCTDSRNTRVISIVHELKEYACKVDVYDPWIDKTECMHEYGIELIDSLSERTYDAIIIAVAHEQFLKIGVDGIRKLLKPNGVIYDLKWLLKNGESDIRL